MNRGLLVRLAVCLLSFSFCLYSYLNAQNMVTERKMKLPQIAKEIRTTREEIKRLHYEIERFENPSHLLELSASSQFTHLKHPLVKDVLTVHEGIALRKQKSTLAAVGK
ncbi:MAG: hypothetical protein WCP39_02530 [Chlamydiota bacterium]